MPKDPTPTGSLTLPKFGRYRVLSKLGQGGMGAVYLACDDKLDRQVAIKVLPPESVHDPAAVARFEREAKALAKLAHPGIIQAFDSESADGRYFLVMEYVDGHSLADVLKDKGRLAPGRAADYIHQAALALQHAHEKGLIHRDIKPSNLLLSNQGQIKLLDLGLARFLQDQIVDASRTREGVGMGTPDYSAPEQFRDAHSADARSDIYALGCTLYHLLSGQVPFPGSSLSEKYKAHCQQEPTPLEELCPDAPAGLVLAVQRMMAKWPAKRFQTAQEVADALSTHVAGSSASFTHLKSTATWHQGQLTVTDLRPRRRRLLWTGATVLLAALLVGLGYGLSRYLRTPTNEGQQARGTEETDPNGPGKKPDNGTNTPKKDEAKIEEPDDPNVLTVSQKPEGGGRFRTINAALENVKPGMTIRVLDDATYSEAVTLTSPSSQAGITLEARRHATLEAPASKNVVSIFNVPRVTLRGFHVRAAGASAYLVAVGGRSGSGCLEYLELTGNRPERFVGVTLEGLESTDELEPYVIRHCVIRGAGAAVRVSGVQSDQRTPQVSRNSVIQNLFIKDAFLGIMIAGDARRVQVVGNVVVGTQTAIQFTNPLEGMRDIWIANNSFFETTHAIKLIHDAAKTYRGTNINLRNNLILGTPGPDMVFVDNRGQLMTESDPAPGDGKSLHGVWRFDHNWREAKIPTGDSVYDKGWIPPSSGDTLRPSIDVASRDSKSPDFLRPAADSPLATQGAGVTDRALPRYVGALPPNGMPAWDWDRTWRAPPPGKLITVSKDPNDKADFATIGAALEKATPWTTIRVVDDGIYTEVLNVDDKSRQEGVWLDAPKRATIRLGLETRSALRVRDVRYVRITGFRFTDVVNQRDPMRRFITVTGQSAGSVLADLNFKPESMTIGIVLEEVDAGPGEAPVCVERCRFEPQCLQMNDGILVTDRPTRRVCRGVCLRDNRVTRCQRGVQLQGKLTDVQVTGNLIWNCRAVCLQLEDIHPASRRLLLANNTAFRGDCLRVWDNKPFPPHGPGQVEVVNNLFFDGDNVDIAFLQDSSTGGNPPAGDGAALLRTWPFHFNYRDFSGILGSTCLPPAAQDARLDRNALMGTDAGAPDLIRPRPKSSLATGGAGTDNPTLPVYIGALPPEGVEPWDWERTWRARSPKVPLAAPK